jgi:hypothetical protein
MKTPNPTVEPVEGLVYRQFFHELGGEYSLEGFLA